MPNFIAHTSEDGRKQLLKNHLEETAEQAKIFAEVFMAGELGYIVGITHDIGKYSSAFQNRILNNGPKVDHSTAGAYVLYKKYKNKILPNCVAGHHSGLLNVGTKFSYKEEASLSGRLKKGEDLVGYLDYSAYEREIKLPLIAPSFPSLISLEACDEYRTMFFVRMLYSCLVDADYLNTEKFVSNDSIKRNSFTDINNLYNRFVAYIAELKQAKGVINEKRGEILRNCLDKAKEESGIFSLTVPTGGGKTISSLGFALKHAVRYGKKRIIYVIPYTSIIEQNADVFRRILGKENVVEHHMNVDYDDNEDGNDKFKLATENWDAPVIVTTNVQFFESLYACKSSKSRKIHNIANSVIIFDEAQMLPNEYLIPCVRAIEELVVNYKVTSVLCTATQPSLNKFLKKCKITEIMPDVNGLYTFFKRVGYKNLGNMVLDELCRDLNIKQQVLCITNSKKEAQDIFDRLDGVNKFHLTTSMYPEHRKKILAKVRLLLKQGAACQLVATSLIEAGVDVDFPVVYRELAGIDSIIQAGGRCNREGKNTNKNSCVYVYSLNTEYRLPSFIKQPIEATKLVMKSYEDISSISAIFKYFDSLHFMKGVEALDTCQILELCKKAQFREVAEKFKLIQDNTKNIFLPITPEAVELEIKLRSGVRNRNLLRKIGKYSVAVYKQQFERLLAMSKLEVLDNNISILIDLSAYDKEKGLCINTEDGVGMFI